MDNTGNPALDMEFIRVRTNDTGNLILDVEF